MNFTDKYASAKTQRGGQFVFSQERSLHLFHAIKSAVFQTKRVLINRIFASRPLTFRFFLTIITTTYICCSFLWHTRLTTTY